MDWLASKCTPKKSNSVALVVPVLLVAGELSRVATLANALQLYLTNSRKEAAEVHLISQIYYAYTSSHPSR